MFSYSKLLIFAVIVGVGSYVGVGFYRYYKVDTTPKIEMLDFDETKGYAGKATIRIKGADDYKVARLLVNLDGKSIVDEKIGKKSFERSVTIDTATLPDGKHDLVVEIAGAAQQGKKARMELPFYVDNQPLQAAFVKNEHDARVPQGRTLHVQFRTNKEIDKATAHVFAKDYPCFAESNREHIYECFIPIDCEEVPKEHLIMIDVKDKVGHTTDLRGKFLVEAFPLKSRPCGLSLKR